MQFQNVRARHHRFDRIERFAVFAIAEHLLFVARAGITYAQAQHETIELRFRQRVSPVMFDRVLGGEHDERLRQGVCRAFDCHLPFGHRFEQRRLSFRGGAIDFVGEYDVGEDRAGLPFKKRAVLIENREPDHIRRQQIGSELNSLKRTVQRSRQRMCQRGFANASALLRIVFILAREQPRRPLPRW